MAQTPTAPEPTMRHVVTLSNLDPVLHRWLMDKAAQRSRASGTNIPLWQLVEEAVRDYKEKTEKAEAAK